MVDAEKHRLQDDRLIWPYCDSFDRPSFLP
jgi:hypothetical protein